VYYCTALEDAVAVGLGISKEIYDDLQKNKEERSLSMIHMRLEKGQLHPLKLWSERS